MHEPPAVGRSTGETGETVETRIDRTGAEASAHRSFRIDQPRSLCVVGPCFVKKSSQKGSIPPSTPLHSGPRNSQPLDPLASEPRWGSFRRVPRGQARGEPLRWPRSLQAAIYLQALQHATSGAELRKCSRPGCPEYRSVGPGTGRTRTNRPVWYCSPTCQKAAAYLRKKGEIQ